MPDRLMAESCGHSVMILIYFIPGGSLISGVIFSSLGIIGNILVHLAILSQRISNRLGCGVGLGRGSSKAGSFE
jgi:hypothetical protein